ncbi:phosphotransferase [Actinoalloteichus caeruleus]|uniref:phosphotransferase n=1 Tax=Actinoalloteichus cyanogriseus TaxID=2893586 RepID=UPI00068AD7A5|nr:phosphotransferase [Actinoalloteichus caeruleus]
MADYTSPVTAGFTHTTSDLRKQPIEKLLTRVEARFATVLDRETVVRKRRSVGARTNRGTWIRIEVRTLTKISEHGQVADGVEAAELLKDVAKPAWYGGTSWLDPSAPIVWRADEVEFVPEPTVRRGPEGLDVTLPDAWWNTLNASLDALAVQRTNRIATPDTETISQGLVTREIERAFPRQVDSTITGPWTTAHADLNWSNLTAPDCWILDWEDHGMAPRGLDAATLWASSLTVPRLAERVHQERHEDLSTRPGQLMVIFCVSKILNDSSTPTSLRELIYQAVGGLLASLQP